MKALIMTLIATASISTFATDNLGTVSIQARTVDHLAEKCDDMKSITANAILAEKKKHSVKMKPQH